MFPGEVSRWKTVFRTSCVSLPRAPRTASKPTGPPAKAALDWAATAKTAITRPLASAAESTVTEVESAC